MSVLSFHLFPDISRTIPPGLLARMGFLRSPDPTPDYHYTAPGFYRHRMGVTRPRILQYSCQFRACLCLIFTVSGQFKCGQIRKYLAKQSNSLMPALIATF